MVHWGAAFESIGDEMRGVFEDRLLAPHHFVLAYRIRTGRYGIAFGVDRQSRARGVERRLPAFHQVDAPELIPRSAGLPARVHRGGRRVHHYTRSV